MSWEDDNYQQMEYDNRLYEMERYEQQRRDWDDSIREAEDYQAYYDRIDREREADRDWNDRIRMEREAQNEDYSYGGSTYIPTGSYRSSSISSAYEYEGHPILEACSYALVAALCYLPFVLKISHWALVAGAGIVSLVFCFRKRRYKGRGFTAFSGWLLCFLGRLCCGAVFVLNVLYFLRDSL